MEQRRNHHKKSKKIKMPTWPCNTRCSFSALNDTISKDRIWKSACRDLSTWVYRKLLSAFWKNRGVKNLFFTKYIHNQLRQPAVWRPLLMPRNGLAKEQQLWFTKWYSEPCHTSEVPESRSRISQCRYRLPAVRTFPNKSKCWRSTQAGF